MDVDESNKQKLKDDYSSGLISIDEYTEGLVRLVVSFCFGFDLCCAKLMCLISHMTVSSVFYLPSDNSTTFYQASMKEESSVAGQHKERNEQYLAYNSEAEEGKTIDSINAVEQNVKNSIYPRIKFLSDNEEDFHQPDFLGDAKGKQAAAICNCILDCLGKSEYTIKQKVLWWVAYRKIIKRKLCKLRQANVRSLQTLFIEGKANIKYIVCSFVVF